MSIHISSNLVLGQAELLRENAARLCWQNIVDVTNVSATSEEDENPVTNLANPSTAFVWQATSNDEQSVEVEIDTVIDYIGIARHNLQPPAQIRIQVYANLTYTTVFDWATINNDNQVLLYFLNDAEPDGIKIDIRDNDEPPIIGVLRSGVSTLLERNIYVGHTPITYGRDLTVVGGVSESGQYIGEVIRKEIRTTSVSLENLTPSWYREELDPFFAQRPRDPAFWAWRPGDYESEVGYVWVTGNPRPVNQRGNGMMSVEFNLEGIA